MAVVVVSSTYATLRSPDLKLRLLSLFSSLENTDLSGIVERRISSGAGPLCLDIADFDAHSHRAPHLVPAVGQGTPQFHADVPAGGQEQEGEEEH